MPFLREAGYATLCIDLQAHGESRGDRITFGAREGHDVRAAVAEVRRRWPGRPVAVLGQSLGGAACLLADPPLEVEAAVVELVYPNIEDATANRIGMVLGGVLGSVLAPLMTMQSRLRLGVPASALRPEAGIARLAAPVFVLGGERDEHTPPAETRRLFAAAREPKELWIVPGAGHENLHAVGGGEYERRVLAFFARHLRR